MNEAIEVMREAEKRAWDLLCHRLQRDPATSEEDETCSLRSAWKAMLAFAALAQPEREAEETAGLPDFESAMAIEKETPHGGLIKFGVGALRFPDGHNESAVAIQINGPNGATPDHLVAQFALRMESFAVLLEGMMEVFSAAQALSEGPKP